MTEVTIWIAGGVGLSIVMRAGAVYRATDRLAFGLVTLIGAGLIVGTIELAHRARRARALGREAEALPTPATIEAIESTSPTLRTMLQARVAGMAAPASAPPLAAYLLGLLVMLGLLGTFLGLFDSLRGAREALTTSADPAALRAALAAPMQGLSRAFGTSAAGVSASAMLGLALVFARRAEAHAATAVARYAVGPLSSITVARRTLDALEAIALQGAALPGASASMERAATTLAGLSDVMRDELRAVTEGVRVELRDASAASARAAAEAVAPRLDAVVAQAAASSRDQARALTASLDSANAARVGREREHFESIQRSFEKAALSVTNAQRAEAEALRATITSEAKRVVDEMVTAQTLLADAESVRAERIAGALEAAVARSSEDVRASTERVVAQLEGDATRIGAKVGEGIGAVTAHIEFDLQALSAKLAEGLSIVSEKLDTRLEQVGGRLDAASVRLEGAVVQASDRLGESVTRAAAHLDDSVTAATKRLDEGVGASTDLLGERVETSTAKFDHGIDRVTERLDVGMAGWSKTFEGSLSEVTARLDVRLGEVAERLDLGVSTITSSLEGGVGSVTSRLDAGLARVAARLDEGLAPVTERLVEVAVATTERLDASVTKSEERTTELYTRLDRLAADVDKALLGAARGLSQNAEEIAAKLDGHVRALAEFRATFRDEDDARSAALASKTGETLAALTQTVSDGISALVDEAGERLRTQGDRDAARDAKLVALVGQLEAVTGAIAEDRAAHGERLAAVEGRLAEAWTDATSSLRKGGDDLGALAERFDGAVDRYREASERWLGGLSAMRSLADNAAQMDAQDLLAAYLEQTREVFEGTLRFQRQLFDELRKKDEPPPTPYTIDSEPLRASRAATLDDSVAEMTVDGEAEAPVVPVEAAPIPIAARTTKGGKRRAQEIAS